jgi:hypothetical protein
VKERKFKAFSFFFKKDPVGLFNGCRFLRKKTGTRKIDIFFSFQRQFVCMLQIYTLLTHIECRRAGIVANYDCDLSYSFSIFHTESEQKNS